MKSSTFTTTPMIESHFISRGKGGEFKMEVDWIERFIPHGTMRILEIGCGGGYMLFRLKHCFVVGIDLFYDGLKNTQNNIEDALLVCANGSKLLFADNSFNLIIIQHVIEHIIDVKKAMQEWNRVLTPNGRLIIVTPNKWYCDHSVFEDRTHVHIYNKHDIGLLLIECGFNPIEMRSIGLPFFRNYQGRRGVWRLRKLLLERALALSYIPIIRWRGQSLCCVAMKCK